MSAWTVRNQYLLIGLAKQFPNLRRPIYAWVRAAIRRAERAERLRQLGVGA